MKLVCLLDSQGLDDSELQGEMKNAIKDVAYNIPVPSHLHSLSQFQGQALLSAF